MFIRIVRPTIKADKVEAAAQHWESIMAPRVQNNPMLERGFMAATADRSSVVAVTIWNQLPDPDATKKMMEEVAGQMRDYAEGPPAFDDYEVLGQV